ncbi:ribose transport system permease protein [Paraburkholderia sp. BL27I4N3]|uniref:ABC transporter permease n=1 Tax=Paraburkholderia sp. BL27I4N3 TaxID=1938805 RepID=UPI000E386639|nr:ABC transporter permease [Paraburkholderia sp. BL27I4N3]REE07104.1 ribose transport system permease protein [Paraburkholderia sp. BL27I4N3]
MAIAVFVVLFGIVNGLSATRYSFTDLSYLSSGGMTLALAAVGATIVILTGGFDLSAGAVISLVNVVIATHLTGGAGSQVGVVVAGVAIGAVIGAFNGFFVAVLRLQSIVVTLSTMFIVTGITLLTMDKPGGVVPDGFVRFFTGNAIEGVLPAPVLILAAVVLLWVAIKHTRFGTALYAVGGDQDAAAYAGINVSLTKFSAYVLAGIAYGIAGVLVTAQTSTGDPLVGDPLLLQMFTAVVLGGTALGGGRGGCVGSIFGAYSLMLIVNILLVLNVPAYYATVVEGGVLILAALSAAPAPAKGTARWLRQLFARRAVAPSTQRPVIRLIEPAVEVVKAASWLQRNRDSLRYVIPAYVCLILVIVASVFVGQSISLSYFNSLLLLGSFLIVIALGQGAVILTGGLDLSIPWTIGLCGILLGGLVRGSDAAAVWAVPLVLGVGALIGVVNGAAIVVFRLPPIVVTLAMNGILQGIALLYSNGTPDGFASPSLRWLMTGQLGVFSPIVYLVILFVIFATLLLSRTVFGRRVYAVGNSQRVAHLSGVNVGRVLVSVYALSGICSAVVGVLLTGFGGQASLGMGDAFLLPSIAVVVIGGTLITGGRGLYIGMVGGALLLTALQTMLAGTTIPPSLRDVIYGAVVLAAVVALREKAAT